MKNIYIFITIIIIIGSVFILFAISSKQKITTYTMPTIQLPDPKFDSTTSVEKALKNRRSIRQYSEATLSLEEISQLLWSAQGITDPSKGYRTSPSAGALYPLEIYLEAHNVMNLAQGVYKYIPQDNLLVLIQEGMYNKELAEKSMGQAPVANGSANIIITGVFDRTVEKYGEQGYKYVYMEAGHAAQNIYLQSISLGLGTVTIAAFNNKEVIELLNIQENAEVLYIMPIGKK